MKRLFRHFVIDTFCLWVISRLTSGLVFEGGLKTLLITGVGVSFVSILAKPVINLLLLPLNLITFGLFRWISSAVIIYLVSLLVKEFKVQNFFYSGFRSVWLDIPQISFEGFMSYVAFSFLLSALMSFIYWLIK